MVISNWFNSYVTGTTADCVLPVVPVQQVLDEAAEKWPLRPALNFMGRSIHYAELQQLVNRAAKGFQALGVRPGVHVGLYLPNTPHYIISFFGVIKAGGTVVNYSPLDAEQVLAHKIEDSKTVLMVTLDLTQLYPRMRAMLEATHLKRLIIGSMAEMSADPVATRSHMQVAGLISPGAIDERHCTFAALLDNDGDFCPYPVTNPETTLAVLQYTGGTTGLPKGAMLTHGNLSAATAQFRSIIRNDPVPGNGNEVRLSEVLLGEDDADVLNEGQERFLVVLPLFHIFALSVNVLFGLCLGAELVLHAKFELDAVLETIRHHKITVFAGVPSMFTAMVNCPDPSVRDLASLKFCLSGGAPMMSELGRAFEHLSGCNLLEGWGMTETAAGGSFTPAFGVQKAGSCGKVLPGISIRVVDVANDSVDVAQGERGELCIKGPNVMSAYWNDAAMSVASMTADGYFKTGDVVYLDADGYIFIVDRSKDMLLCGGFNVYPRVIEEAISEHPSVQEVAVIGIFDAYRGESPKAFITLKKDAEQVSLDQMRLFLKTRLGKHEMLYAMEIRTDLPKTLVGKLSKKVLIDEERLKLKQMKDAG